MCRINWQTNHEDDEQIIFIIELCFAFRIVFFLNNLFVDSTKKLSREIDLGALHVFMYVEFK